jgi:putative ABC transport system ATP-binding protein
MTIVETSIDLRPPVVAGGRDVHVVDLTVSYVRGSTRVTPVSGLTFYSPSSRITALVGRSGSGKTSILSTVAGMLRPQSGAVWLGGIDVTALRGADLDAYRRRHVGVVHQAYNLIPSLTAMENVSVPLTLVGMGRREARARAGALLERLGLGDVHQRRPHELSGGQQQRIAVARALAPGPSVIVADEPTSNLDGSSVSEVRDLFRSIADDGCTVILSTHDDRLLSLVDQTIHLGA